MIEQTQHNFDRRASDRNARQESKVRQEIFEQMSEIEDAGYRVMMTMMLKLQDETQTEIAAMTLLHQGYMHKFNTQLERITEQLERISKTGEQIKKDVLNGHAENHDDDHDYIKELRKQDVMCGLVLRQHGDDGLCEHARQMIEEKEVAKRRQWKMVDGIYEKVGLILFAVFAAALFPHLASYFK
jgi:hypothetical protein